MHETYEFLQTLWGAVGFVAILFAGMFFTAIFKSFRPVLIMLLTVSLFGLYNLFYVIDSHLGRATSRELPAKFFVAALYPGQNYDFLWIIADFKKPDEIKAYQIPKEESQKMQEEAAKQGSETIEGKVVERDGENHSESLSIRELDPLKDLNHSKN